MSARIFLFCAVLVALWVGGASAQDIYQWRDAQGTVHFSDRPPPYPANVTVDGQISPPTAPPSAPAVSRMPNHSPRYVNSQRKSLRNSALNPSISSLIGGGSHSRMRRAVNDPAAADSSGSISGTSLADPAEPQPVPTRRRRAARPSGPADDLAVPSLDGALSQNLLSDGSAAAGSTTSHRPANPPSEAPSM